MTVQHDTRDFLPSFDVFPLLPSDWSAVLDMHRFLCNCSGSGGLGLVRGWDGFCSCCFVFIVFYGLVTLCVGLEVYLENL